MKERDREGSGRWSRATMLDSHPKTKYHSTPAAIKACLYSITYIYQGIKCMTDVKRVKEHVEMREGLGEGKCV